MAASIIVSPNCTTAAPAACFANRPLSMTSRRPAKSCSIRCTVTCHSSQSTPMQRGRPAVLVRGALADPQALVTETELLDERAIGRKVAALEILEESASGADHLEQPPPTVVVLGVGAEVVGERIDPLRQERDLNPGRAGVGVVPAMLGDHGLLVERHAAEILGTILFQVSSASMLARQNNLAVGEREPGPLLPLTSYLSLLTCHPPSSRRMSLENASTISRTTITSPTIASRSRTRTG